MPRQAGKKSSTDIRHVMLKGIDDRNIFLAEGDAYLVAVARCIHQNSVKAGMEKETQSYPWSSFCHY